MKSRITAIMIALATVPGVLVLMAPVNAQFKPMSKPVSKEREAAEAAAKKKGDNDSGYKSAIERLPDKKFDPWANMR